MVKETCYHKGKLIFISFGNLENNKLIMELDGVHHIGVNVSNLDRAESFYTDILGFKVIDRYQEEIRHSMLDTGTTKIHLFESTDLEFDDAITRLSEDGYAQYGFWNKQETVSPDNGRTEKTQCSISGTTYLGQRRVCSF